MPFGPAAGALLGLPRTGPCWAWTPGIALSRTTRPREELRAGGSCERRKAWACDLLTRLRREGFESLSKSDEPGLRIRHWPPPGLQRLPSRSTMLVLPLSACLFLATVEILLAGESSFSCNSLATGWPLRPKIRPGASPASMFQQFDWAQTRRRSRQLSRRGAPAPARAS